ncbi:hypothetical protein LN996_11390 [Arthrobacter sp. AK01]|uniref:hypothetical protein n=1 Tax=Micrococcaceae TaxID=1268 RepID=UPI001E591686|nr:MULTISPECIES: hypothetical protein [Micrococcaceae]MCD4851415.1 hypothetical protein [Arthrobacter sp. AK01]MCP1412306.1 hypothetical protein [Paenarthrobacter sp. A20]
MAEKPRRAFKGGLVGLAIGYVSALLFTGFDPLKALVAWLWVLPAMLGVAVYGLVLERRQRS